MFTIENGKIIHDTTGLCMDDKAPSGSPVVKPLLKDCNLITKNTAVLDTKNNLKNNGFYAIRTDGGIHLNKEVGETSNGKWKFV